MSTLILEAPKVFLDTCHLINIADVRAGRSRLAKNWILAYEKLDSFFRERQFGLVFNSFSAMEWIDGNATKESAYQIADVIDSAKLLYEFHADSFAYLSEVLAELRRIDSRLELPEYDILSLSDARMPSKRPEPELLRFVPDFFGPENKGSGPELLENKFVRCSARTNVDLAWTFRETRNAAYRERVDGHRAAFEADAAHFRNRTTKGIGNDEVVSWMKRFLKTDRVIAAQNPHADIDHLLRAVDIKNCPAIELYMRAHEKRARAGNQVKESDVGDWAMVPIVPYVDVFVTEKVLAMFLLQGDRSLTSKITNSAEGAINLLRRWL